MTLREILRLLLKNVAYLGMALVLAVGVGAVYLAAQGSEYTASAQVLLSQRDTAKAGADGVTTQQKLNLVAVTYSKLVGNPDFLRTAANRAGVSVPGASVSGDTFLNASIVRINAKAPTLTAASGAAGSVAQLLQSELTNAGGTAGSMRAQIVQRPVAHKSSPSRPFTLAASAIAGLAIAATAILLLDNP